MYNHFWTELEYYRRQCQKHFTRKRETFEKQNISTDILKVDYQKQVVQYI